MKPNKITAAVLALGLTAVLGISAHAGTAVNSPGDVFIGFQQSGATNDYVVDLGAASQFVNDTSSNPLQYQLSVTDLNADFGGTNWSNNDPSVANLVQWGVIGGTSKTASITIGGDTLPENTIFYTVGELTPGTQTAAPSQNQNTQASINGNTGIYGLTNGNNGFHFHATAAGSTSSLQAVNFTAASSPSWTHYAPATTAFGIGSSIEQPATGSATGPTDSTLDLYEFNNTTANNQSGAFLGSFNLNSSGLLTFDAAAPASVPEPSSYALMALGAVALFWRLRRKHASVL